MKITIYTVPDCQFSKQEIEYLKSKNLQYEEKNLEANKDFLTEMLALGDNFAGTPLTRIEKDDGQSVVLKGFTQEEFDVALGFKPAEPTAKAPGMMGAQPTADTSSPLSQTPTPPEPKAQEPPPIPTVIEPPASTSPPPQPEATLPDQTSATTLQPPVAPQEEKINQQEAGPQPSIGGPGLSSAAGTEPVTPTPQPPPPPSTPPQAPVEPVRDEKLSSVLNNLQSMSNEPTPLPGSESSSQTPPSNPPSIPEPKFG